VSRSTNASITFFVCVSVVSVTFDTPNLFLALQADQLLLLSLAAMATLYSVTVKDINAHDFNRAYAAYLKR